MKSFAIIAAAAVSLASTATAAALAWDNAAIVIVEAHNGLHSTNSTIAVEFGHVYAGGGALHEVSTLYLGDTIGAPFDSVTCTPHHASNGQGTGGRPFNSTSPSFLSTNTVVVGSIVCITTHGS
jgi:opacity protein-like surface antigen